MKTHKLRVLAATAASVLAAALLVGGTASAQTLNCPAGGRGGSGGDGGISRGGNGGLAFTIGGFGTAGSANASGGNAGSARGGSGGRGGAGVLPICNQNTNGPVARAAPAPVYAAPVAAAAPRAAAPPYAAPAAAPRAAGAGGGASYGGGGGYGGALAATGGRIDRELGYAGLALIVGGLLMFAGQPFRRAVRLS